MSRLELLKKMFQTRDRYDGILFVVRGDEAPSTSSELPDGSVSVDIRPEVPVPSLDTDIWDEANCQDAFDALAQATSTEHYPEITPGLAFRELTPDEFMGWLRGRGFPVPSFWKPTLEKPKRGRPPTYNWEGVKAKLETYVAEHGPVRTSEELIQKCGDFAADLHPKNDVPSDKTIRDAVKKHALDAAAGFIPGK